MVLIIRNNRIQSRRNTRLKRLLSRVVPANRENYFAKNRRVPEENKTVAEAMTLVAVMGTLFLYSAAMFTLPFAAFYGARHIVTKYDADRFTTNCISVLAAVITVNVIIGCYAYKALTEPDDPKGNDDDRGDEDDPSDQRSHGKTD